MIKAHKGKRGFEEDVMMAGILVEVAQEMKKEIKNDPGHLKVCVYVELEGCEARERVGPG